MKNLTNIGVVKEILEKHGFNFSKGLGQNFLINPDVCPKIAEMKIIIFKMECEINVIIVNSDIKCFKLSATIFVHTIVYISIDFTLR